MATYLIKKEKTITRQEGDTADIVIVVPDVLDMANYDAEFKVFSTQRRELISKKTAAGSAAKDGQTITIPLASADTKGQAGKHRWEMQLVNDTPEVITVGRGAFIIEREYVR